MQEVELRFLRQAKDDTMKERITKANIKFELREKNIREWTETNYQAKITTLNHMEN